MECFWYHCQTASGVEYVSRSFLDKQHVVMPTMAISRYGGQGDRAANTYTVCEVKEAGLVREVMTSEGQ